MSSMRRVVVDAISITVEQVEAPVPTPSQALVRTVVSGVCGSDTHAAHGRHPFIALPYHPGHEVVGVVEALGAAYLSIAWKDAFAFCVLIVILIVRPTGLLGERAAVAADAGAVRAALRTFGLAI